MADKPIKVKAYGKILNFPAGTTPEAIESAVAEHEHLLNPEYERPSGAGGLLGNVVRGAKSTGRLVSAGYDAFTDDRSGVEKTAATSNLAAERETPVEQQSLQAELHGIDREQGVMAQMGDTLKAAGRNPMGTGQLVAEQLPNSAVILAGGYAGFKGGALAGAPFGPAGVAIGGALGFLGGMFLGNTLIEAGSKGIQKASDDDGFTPQDKDDTIRESAIKGAVLTGVDAATLKLGSVVMKRLGSTAVREGAKAEAKVLMDAGVDMSSTTTINAALKSSPELFQAARLAGEKAAVGALSRSKKAGIIGTGLTMETAGEGIGEYAGEYAATGKADVVDATIEALSGATMSAAETAYNFNKLKAGNDLSAQGMMDSITPETLEGKRADAMQKADVINKQQQEQSMADIGAATDVDQAIAAASGAITKPAANANDVLRAEDPTLADIERLTGLKPTHAIDAAIDEINNPIINQPLEAENGNNQTAQQKATTKTPVLKQDETIEDNAAPANKADTAVNQPIRPNDKVAPVAAAKDTSTKVEALTDTSPVLNAETFKASDKTGTSHIEYLKSHPNRKEASSVDLKNVESTLLKGLQKTGKFTATDSKTYAKPFTEFYKVNAERQGILPSELYERMPLKFNGKASPEVGLKQGEVTPIVKVNGKDRPAVDSENRLIANPKKFHEWFGDSKVVDKEGRPLTVYHGTGKDFSEFSADKGEGARYKTGVFLSDSPEVASTYATGDNKNVMKTYVSLKNPVVVDAGGANWSRIGPKARIELPEAVVADKDEALLAELEDRAPTTNASKKLRARKTSLKGLFPQDMSYSDDTMSTNDLVRWAREQGYEGVVIKNVTDSGPAGAFHTEESGKPHTSFVVFNPTQIKSAVGNNGEFSPNDPNILKQSGKKEAPERTLLAQHNISVKGLLHADKMGGLASPSLAIADKGKPLTGFGEITLIGDSNLTDPKQGAKVFGADIYSPRYPSVTLDFTRQSVDRLNEKLRPFIEASNSKDIGYYELGNAGGEREVTRLLQQEPAVLAALLTEKGVKPKYSEKPKVELKKEFKAFAGATDAQTLVSNPDFLKAVRQSHKDFMDEKESGDFTQTDKERFLRNLAYDEAYRVVAYSKYLKGKGKIDPNQSFRSLRLQVDAKNLGGELESYIHDLIGGMRPEEKIFKGFTNSGNRKYIPHTLENIVKELKKNLRGGETFNYGLGTVRSKYTPQFKSLDQIRREKGRLVSDEEFSTIRKEVDDKFSKLGEKLDQHHEAARFDTFAQAAYDAATMGLPRALKENGYTGVPPELIEETGDFLADLAHLPTEYFEVKLPRAVGLSEFSGAVVPKHTPESVINILKKNGITNIKKYKDAEDRKKQIGSFEDQFFQSNFYSALEKEIKNLKKIANKNGEVSVEQAKAWINSRQKEGKFKQAEVEAVGLLDWLDTLEGRVPVTDVEKFVQENGVQVEEVVLEGSGQAEIDEDQLYDNARSNFEQDYELPEGTFDQAISEVADEMLSNHNDGRWGGLIGLNDEEEVEAWLEDEEVSSTRSMVRLLNSRYGPEEVLGTDGYNDIRDAQEQNDWERNQDYYLDQARERLENEAGGGSGGTEFSDYVLRGGGAEYKELLLTLPNNKSKFNAPHFDKAQDDGAENIFAHTRINERFLDKPPTEDQLAEKAAYETELAEFKKRYNPLHAEKERAAAEYREVLARLSENTPVTEILRNPPEELNNARKANEEATKALGELVSEQPEKPYWMIWGGEKERVLFVEEIQSDWVQKGRDEGFRGDRLSKEQTVRKKELEEFLRRASIDVEGREAIHKAQAEFGELKQLEGVGKVAKAPFVTDTKAWTALVVKRLLRYAAENGFDRIAWTTGAQQAERYRLDKFITEVTARRVKDLYQVEAIAEDGLTVFDDLVAGKDLAGTLGAELAEKIINQGEGTASYTGLEIRSGGQGMREFYDRIVPSVVNDVAKKLGGGKVEIVSMGGQAGRVVKGLDGKILITYPNGSYLKNRNTGVMTESQDRADGFESVEEATKFLDRYEAQNLEEPGRQMSLRITPALKEKVMQGLPLFQRDRAGYNPNTFTISLMEGADMTSVIHEGGHFYLEALADMASRPGAPEQIVSDFDTTLKWFGIGEPAAQTDATAVRTQGYPVAAGEPIATFTKADDVKAHPGYAEAKAGDDQAAYELVTDLVTQEDLNQAKERFNDATFVPVSLMDKDGANRISTALAYHYANATGGSVSDSIFESKKAYHTGMNAMERLVSRANFTGKVEPGRKYVLVDDVTTVGSTLADLASYIQSNGGEVVGSVLLANATRSGKMFANAKTTERLERQYGNEIRELFNIEPNALTNEEAQYLIGFRSADELRSSAIKAQGSRLSRIYARQVPERESSVEAKRRREVWQSMSLEQKRPHHEQWAQSFERYALEGVSPTEEMQPVFERFKQWMLETYKSLKEFLKNNPLAGRLNNDVRQVFDRLLASESDIAATAAARGSLKQSGFKNLTVSGKSISQLASAIARRYKAKKEGNSRGSYYYKLPDGRDLRVSDHEFPRKHGGGVANVDVVYSKEDDSVDVFLNKVKTGVVEKELSYRSLSLRGGDMGGLEGFGDDVNAWEEAITSAIDDAVFGRYSQGTKGPGTTPPAGATPAAKGPGTTPPAGATPAAKKPFNPNEDIPETRFRKAQRLSQDAFNRFTVIKEWLKKKGVTLSEKADVFQAEERYHSLVANQLEDFREHRRNPLIEKISKAGFTLDDVADFLEAQHAEEANRAIQDVRGDPTATAYGITDAEAKAYLAKADPKLAKLANELRDITEQSKQMRLKAGLISQDEVDAWEAVYQYYIPVKGDADAKGGTGKGLKVNFKSKRRLGHGKRDEAVIENIFLDHEKAIMQVEKNRVAKHLVMMAAEMNRPEIVSIGQPVKRNTLRSKTAYEVQVSGVTRSVFNTKQAADMFKQLLPTIDPTVQPNTVSVNPTTDQRVIAMASPMLAENEINAYIDGHAIRVQINDDLLARAYGKLGVTGFSALVSAGRAFNGYLSKVYTGYNPEFILTNMIRDFTSGLINLTGEEGGKIAAKAAANYVESFSSLMKYAISNGKKSDKWIDMYRANGGNTGAAYLSDLERLGDEIKTEYASYQGVLANLKSGDIANASRAAGRKVFNITLKWIYNLNQAGENAMRLAAFRAMIESGKTPNQAAKASKNITVNFNRKGELGAEANAAYLFFNASVQGTAALAHAHFKGKHKSQAWGLSSMMGALGYLAAVALMGDDEDDYDKINDYTKSRNLLIKAGEGYVQIPVPYGYGFFWNTGRAIAEAQHKGELGVLPWHIAASAIEELTPFSDTVVGSQAGFHFDQVLLGMLPTVIKIPAQPAFNKQLFSGGELFPERASQQFQPDREKLWRSTQGTMYDRMAGWLSDANVGDVTPETLKHYTRTFTGGTGALVDATISAAMLKKEGAELEPSEIPFVRKAYSKLTIRENRAAYYKAREEAKKTAEAFSRAKTRNDVTTIDKLVKDEGEMLGLDAYANSLSEAIGAVRDLQDAIRVDDSLNAAEKRVQIKELEITEQKFYDQYLDVFKIEKMKMKSRKD